MSVTVNAQALLDQGYRLCGACHGMSRPGSVACRFCEKSFDGAPASGGAINPATSGAGATATQPAKPKRKAPKRRFNPEAPRGDHGSLADLPGQTLVLTVPGRPIQQGSLIPVAPGVVRREDGPDLVAWRDKVTRAALLECGRTWVAANAAVQVDVILTVPRPKTAPKSIAVHADGYRDLDKLVRAIGDALCPNDPARFRVLASDMRITATYATKTHPRPLHTHVDAQESPGVRVMIRALSRLAHEERNTNHV